MRVRGR